MSTASDIETSAGAGGRSPRRTRGSRAGKRLADVGTALCSALVVVAPLAAGGVHDTAMLVLLVLAGVGGALFLAGLAVQRRTARVGFTIVVPLAFLLVPLLQIIPLPMGIRSSVDPAGTTLLRDNAIRELHSWPLSLDPLATHVWVGRAALALVVFVVAHHLASGRTRRHLITRLVSIAGLGAVAIGFGHRMFGVAKLYGFLSSTARTMLTGPFVNSNHTAEFLELAAFSCLACSFQKRSTLNRIGWSIGAAMCAVGAIATMSRGALLAFAAATPLFVLLLYLSREDTPEGRPRSALLWGPLLVAAIGVLVLVLGADALLERFRSGSAMSDVRFQLWRDGWKVLSAHPAGIGRGAFDRVFPAYRTLKTSLPIRFAFLENEPLQLLVDAGWLSFGLIAAAGALAAWQIVRRGRRDKIEAALVAGLVAVLAHSLVDFGLETPGVSVPFVAILGTVLGRTRTEPRLSPALATTAIAVACLGLIIGGVSTRQTRSDDFDRLLRRSLPAGERRQVLESAQIAYPLDYFYALSYAGVQPLAGPKGTSSPRMHALNRALRLCPGCEEVHAEVARTLWRFGMRAQALLEWRSAVTLRPQMLNAALTELFNAGAKAEELAAIATSEPARIIEVAAFLRKMSRFADAVAVLDQADAVGAPRGPSLLVRGQLELDAGQPAAAAVTFAKARALRVDAPEMVFLEARLKLAEGAAGVEPALAVLDAGALRYPENLDIQRSRLDLVLRYERWQAADRALRGLEMALYSTYGSAGEAHAAAARIDARLSRWTNALGKYRVALADDPRNVSLWLEYARAAESAGRESTAQEAYRQAAHISPQNPEIVAALKRLTDRNPTLKLLAPTGHQ